MLELTLAGTVLYYGHLDAEVPGDATYEDLDDIVQEIAIQFGVPLNELSGDPGEGEGLEVDDMITLPPTSHPQYQASRAGNGGWVVK